jgi:hypothetical protein
LLQHQPRRPGVAVPALRRGVTNVGRRAGRSVRRNGAASRISARRFCGPDLPVDAVDPGNPVHNERAHSGFDWHGSAIRAHRWAHEQALDRPPKAKTPPGGCGAFFWGSGIGGSRASRISPLTSEKVQRKRTFGSVALVRTVRVERMREKDADAEEDEERCYDLDHRLVPSVAMPGRAALRNWR